MRHCNKPSLRREMSWALGYRFTTESCLLPSYRCEPPKSALLLRRHSYDSRKLIYQECKQGTALAKWHTARHYESEHVKIFFQTKFYFRSDVSHKLKLLYYQKHCFIAPIQFYQLCLHLRLLQPNCGTINEAWRELQRRLWSSFEIGVYQSQEITLLI